MVKPGVRRQAVHHLVQALPLSERRACRLVNLHRSSCRYRSSPRDDQRAGKRLAQLALTYPSYGYRLLHGLLKAEGLVINPKRTYRLYVAAGLQLPRKKVRKLKRDRQPMAVPTGPVQRWSMDFVSDQLSDGRRFRVLNVIDEYSRECLGQVVDTSITGARVSRCLTELIRAHGRPKVVVCDNGTEFTSKALFHWAKDNEIKLGFIRPGKPVENAFVESFNGKFRSGCLDLNWFRSLAEARHDIEAWRQHYNHVRPHSALGYLPPAVYAKQAA
jgi:putative transposase